MNSYKLTTGQAASLKLHFPAIEVLNDFRIPVLKRAEALFKELRVPITPRLAGEFALDFALEGVSKETAIRYVFNNREASGYLSFEFDEMLSGTLIEIWGDKFSISKGGTDRHMSEALPKDVRSISFRGEDPADFPAGYNIQVWDGKEHLQKGLLEYLKTRG